MTIDKPLNNLDPEQRKPLQKPEKIQNSELMEKYIYAIHHVWKREGIPRFHPEEIQEYSGKMYFSPKLTVAMNPFPSQDLIKIISKNDPELSELLQKTDIKEYLPEQFDISGNLEKECSNMPEYFNLKEIITSTQLFDYLAFTKTHFVLPDLEFLSIFMSEEEKLRKYAKISSKNIGPLLIISEFMNQDIINNKMPSDLFNASDLKKFQEQTGYTKIKQMLDEYNKFLSLTNKSEFDNGTKIKSFLYSKLKKYNPHLVKGGTENANR